MVLTLLYTFCRRFSVGLLHRYDVLWNTNILSGDRKRDKLLTGQSFLQLSHVIICTKIFFYI
jgi:hypothetical protein